MDDIRGRKTLWEREWIVALGLALLVLALRLPSLEQPFDNDSGANAYHARLIVRGEPLYGTHHPSHHMPAVYYVYALAFTLFGDSVWSVKFLLLLWTIASVYLLYRLGATAAGRRMGLLAAFLYAVLSSHILLYGSTAEIELFANLPRIAALLVLTRLLARRRAAWRYVSVGLLSAAAFLFKAVYLSPLALAGLALLIEWGSAPRRVGAWRATLARGAWVGAGFALGLLPVVGYFASLGLLPRFLQVFALGMGYVELPAAEPAGPRFRLIYPILGLAINNALLLVLGLAGLVTALVVWSAAWRRKERQTPGEAYVALWLILSLFEASAARYQFLYYYQLIVPPLAWMAAWFLLKVYRELRNRLRDARRWMATLLLAGVLAASLGLSARQNWEHYASYARYRLGIGTYDEFLYRGWFERLGPRFVQLQQLADYVRARTTPQDYVYYWSGNVQFYYLADRRCPIDMIWPVYAEASGPIERIFVPQTKYVVLGESFFIPRPAWLYAEVERNYVLETVMDGQEIYRRSQ